MTSFQKKLFLTLIFIFLSVGALIFITPGQQKEQKEVPEKEDRKSEQNQETRKKEGSLKGPSKRNLLPQEVALFERQEECQESARELFDSDDSFNISSAEFQNPQRVIEKLHDTFTMSLLSEESVEVYQKINEESHSSKNLLTQDGLERLNASVVCRPEASLRYIETALRAYQEKAWGEETRQEIVYVITTMTANITKNNFAPANIEFIYKIMLHLTEYELISKNQKSALNTDYESFKVAKAKATLKSFEELKTHGEKALRHLELIKEKFAPDYK